MNRIAHEIPDPEDSQGAADLVRMGERLMRLENETMIAVSIQRPRKEEKILQDSIRELELVPEMAAEAFYSIPYEDRQAGQTVQVSGPSINAAMTLVRRWGNAQLGCRQMDEDDDSIQLEAVFIDLESNFRLARPFRVSKWFRKRSGDVVRLNESRLLTVYQAGVSKAIRNVALAGLPKYLVKSYDQKARELASGKQDALAESKVLKAAIEAFSALSITREQLEKHIGRPVQEWTGRDVGDLRGLHNAIRDGVTTIAEVFGGEGKPEPDAPRTVAEAAAQETQSPAAPAGAPVKAESHPTEDGPAGDTPSPEEQAAIRAAEQAEARAGKVRPDLTPVLDVLTQPRPPVANQASQDAPGSPIAGGKVVTGAQKNRERLWALLKKIGKGSMGGVAKLAELTGGKATSVAYLSDEEVATLLNTLSKGGAANA